jgi:DNA-binding GntR family transcriptional regulator
MPAVRSINRQTNLGANDSSVDRATHLIRNKILDLTFQPGQPLNYRDLTDELKLSRTPVREALNHLTAEGLVEQLPNRGITVASLDFSNIRELMDAYQIAQQVAGHCCKFDNNLLTEVSFMQNKQIVALEDGNPLDSSFWATKCRARIMETSGNTYLQDFHKQIANHVRRLMCLVYTLECRNREEKETQFELSMANQKFHALVEDAISKENNELLQQRLVDNVKLFRARIAKNFTGNHFSLMDLKK